MPLSYGAEGNAADEAGLRSNLYPAYGTYVGNHCDSGPGLDSVLLRGVIGGHIAGRWQAQTPLVDKRTANPQQVESDNPRRRPLKQARISKHRRSRRDSNGHRRVSARIVSLTPSTQERAAKRLPEDSHRRRLRQEKEREKPEEFETRVRRD